MIDFVVGRKLKKIAQATRPHRRKAALFNALTVLLLCTFAIPDAFAKRPGSTYCFVGKCHRVKTLNETRSLIGKTVPLVASHYSDCRKDRYNPCGLTSSGEAFHPGRPDNAASPIYPDGTVLLVRNPKTKASVVLRINNAGPYWGNRKLDVSEAAARSLGFRHRGVAKLETKILTAPNKKEARYSRRRKYRSVPGFRGKFDSLKEAERTAVALMMLDATAASVIAPSNSAAMLTAVRSETKRQRKKRLRNRKQLEPIIKTMRLIAEMKPTTARVSVVADATLTPAPAASQLADGLPNRNRKAAIRANELKPDNAARSHQPLRIAETAVEVQTQNSAPSRQFARAALTELAAEGNFLVNSTKRTSVELIRTAEVGTPRTNEWKDLLHTRLDPLSGDRIWRGTLPYLPLPGRPPRRNVPGPSNLARNDGMG